jgi:hypothetical protein
MSPGDLHVQGETKRHDLHVGDRGFPTLRSDGAPVQVGLDEAGRNSRFGCGEPASVTSNRSGTAGRGATSVNLFSRLPAGYEFLGDIKGLERYLDGLFLAFLLA